MFVWSRPTQRRSFRLALLALSALLQLNAATASGAQPLPPDQEEFQSRLASKDWDGAVAAAQRMVTTARQAPAAPERLSAVLSQLGNAQLGKGDFVAAELAFTEALRTLEPIARSADTRLIDPLRGLGFALAEQSKHADAVPYMEKALAILRRTAGLFDMSQQSLLRELAASLTELGKPGAADQQMQYLQRVGEHAYGAEDPRITPLLCTMADWYLQRGQINEARDYFRRALYIVQKNNGENDLAAVEPLRGYARSFVRELILSNYGIRVQSETISAVPDSGPGEARPLDPHFLNADGERALLRALAILDANPARAPDALLETLLQAGDWFQIKDQPQKALPYYQRVVASVPANLDANLRDTVLGYPVPVYYPTPQLAARNLGRPANEVTERFVQVEFTVTAEGYIKDERIVEQDATGRQASQTLEAMRGARYRPKFVNGEPVETLAVSFRQTFKQKKDRDRDRDRDKDKDSE